MSARRGALACGCRGPRCRGHDAAAREAHLRDLLRRAEAGRVRVDDAVRALLGEEP